jgi:hypothetical protein
MATHEIAGIELRVGKLEEPKFQTIFVSWTHGIL